MENSIKEIDKIIKDKILDFEEEPSLKMKAKFYFHYSKKIITNTIIAILLLVMVAFFWLLLPELDANIWESNVLENNITNKTLDSTVVQIEQLNKVSKKLIITEKSNYYELNNINDLKSNVVKSDKVNYPNSFIAKESAAILSNSKSLISKENELVNISKLKPISLCLPDVLPKNYFICKEETYIVSDNDFINDISVNKNISLSFEWGQSVSWKQMSEISSSEDLFNLRKGHEERTINTVFGFKFNYHIKNWIISSGLGYSVIGEKLNYNLTKTVIDPEGGIYHTDTIWAKIYDPDNGWDKMIIGYDITYEEAYKDVNYSINKTNKYSYIELPFMIARKFSFSKFSFQPSVGVTIGFLYDADGRIPVSNSIDFVELSRHSPYLQTTVSNIVFDVGFEYRKNRDFGFYFKPFYKHGLNSIYKNYPLNSVFYSAGFNVGINVYL